jgi:hypothetical protein
VNGFVVTAADQLPEDVGKSGPFGFFLIVCLFIAVVLLVKSMSRHLKRVPRSFDADDEPRVDIPDTPAELVDPPGQQLLDQLRRAPRAIEPPRRDQGPDEPAGS